MTDGRKKLKVIYQPVPIHFLSIDIVTKAGEIYVLGNDEHCNSHHLGIFRSMYMATHFAKSLNPDDINCWSCTED